MNAVDALSIIIGIGVFIVAYLAMRYVPPWIALVVEWRKQCRALDAAGKPLPWFDADPRLGFWQWFFSAARPGA